MNAVNGATLLILGAILVAVFYALRSTPRARGRARRARRDPTSLVMSTPRPCHITACIHQGWVVVRRGDQTVRVCQGHHDEGYARGWWTPQSDLTTDPAGAAS